MATIEHECFEDFINQGYFSKIEAGHLNSPIHEITVQRNSKLEIIATTIGNNSTSTFKQPSVNSVKKNTEEVRLTRTNGVKTILKGVLSQGYKTQTSSNENSKTMEQSYVHSIESTIKDKLLGRYLIEWLVNVDKNIMFPNSTSKSNCEKTKITISKENDSVTLHSATDRLQMGYNCVHITVNSTELYLCKSFEEKHNPSFMPGYILYKSIPTEQERKKIRDCLSFSLGKYLIYMGHTIFCNNWELVSFKAVSPYTFKSLAFNLPLMPPAPIIKDFDLNQEGLSTLTNALYKCYENYDLEHVFTQYWHATCVPINIAGIHFGAAFDALQNAWETTNKISKTILDKNSWGKLKTKFNEIINNETICENKKNAFKEKMDELNRLSLNKLRNKFIKALDINFTKIEQQAWEERNRSAHGRKIKNDESIKQIKMVRLLQMRIHRTILRLSQGSDCYIDYYTERSQFISRNLAEGVSG